MSYFCRCGSSKYEEEPAPDRIDRIATEDIAPVLVQRLRVVSTMVECSGNDVIERIEEPDGIYEGNIKENRKSGRGCYLWYNGNFYNGDWEADQMTGNGTLFYSNGGTLKGSFVDGKLSGLGRSVYANGDTYVGVWKTGTFHGKGLYYIHAAAQWQLGVFDEGSMVRTISQGEGKPSSLKIKAKYGNLAKEFNEFCWGGELFFDRYEGDVMDGLRDGNGTFVFGDGSFYTGQWRHNAPSGLGLFHYTDEKYDTGIYKDGLLDGYGRAQYANGDLYEGYFKQGNMNGLGLYYLAESDTCLFGKFVSNRIAEEINKFERVKVADLSFRKMERELMPQPSKELAGTQLCKADENASTEKKVRSNPQLLEEVKETKHPAPLAEPRMMLMHVSAPRSGDKAATAADEGPESHHHHQHKVGEAGGDKRCAIV